nr:AAA family ATPase [Azomonas macrocytogenes]
MPAANPFLNQILFGPPGSGKTHAAIDAALEILAPESLQLERAQRKARFDALVANGQARFVTFHQSFSYEDFVEGLRAVTTADRQLEYRIEPGIFKRLCDAARGAPEPYVLVIDEINRGNVSRIFGELITLIEPSKRAGTAEALSVALPYSKDSFSVPANVHLVGTMNTADRSLAGLDIALRRRFVFREMPPRPELLDTVDVDGVNIGQLLRVLNLRIERLLDRDHCLGHAYFMPLAQERTLARLELIFRNQVLPLLQEYFFEDWQRIHWVLNDQRKALENRFIYQRNQDLLALFGEDVSLSEHDLPWSLNEAAFRRIEAYRGIVDHRQAA